MFKFFYIRKFFKFLFYVIMAYIFDYYNFIYFLIVLELITLILLSKMKNHFNRRSGKIVSFKNKKKYKLLMI